MNSHSQNLLLTNYFVSVGVRKIFYFETFPDYHSMKKVNGNEWILFKQSQLLIFSMWPGTGPRTRS